MKMHVPESEVDIWEAEDVERYAGACVNEGLPAVAAIIRTEWEIGQRLTDVRMFRWTESWKHSGQQGPEYDAAAAVLRCWQKKTKSYVTVPISEALRAVLQACIDGAKRVGSIYLLTDAETGATYRETPLSKAFQRVREAIYQDGDRPLVIRALRHSCVVQLARAGCTVPEIAAITGHAVASVHAILARYLPRDNEVAWAAQAKRGLISGKKV